VQVLTVGSKALRYAQKQGLNVVASFEPATGPDAMFRALTVARTCRSLYESGQVAALHVVYTRFAAMARHVPTSRQLLPIVRRRDEGRRPVDYIFQPPAPVLLSQLLPQAVESEICQILLEAEASEQAARMIAMSTATDNAQDMIAQLTRNLNRARQQNITNEILDIIYLTTASVGKWRQVKLYRSEVRLLTSGSRLTRCPNC